VAYAWAVSLGGEAGAKLLTKFGLVYMHIKHMHISSEPSTNPNPTPNSTTESLTLCYLVITPTPILTRWSKP
jgi:hypothetical protein